MSPSLFCCPSVCEEDSQEPVIQYSLPTLLNEPANLQLGEELEQLAESCAGQHLLLDFSEVEYLTSSTLTLLTCLNRKLRSQGSRLSIRQVKPHLFEIFEITRLDTLLDVHPE